MSCAEPTRPGFSPMMPPDSLILVSVGFHLPCYIFSSETPFSPLRNTALPDSCDLWLLAHGVAVSCLFSGLAPVGSFYWWGPQGHPQVRGSLGVGTASVLQPKDTKGSGLRKSARSRVRSRAGADFEGSSPRRLTLNSSIAKL